MESNWGKESYNPRKKPMGEYDNHPSEPWTFPGLADHVQEELPGSLTQSSCQESIECSPKCLLLCQDYGPYWESLVDWHMMHHLHVCIQTPLRSFRGSLFKSYGFCSGKTLSSLLSYKAHLQYFLSSSSSGCQAKNLA